MHPYLAVNVWIPATVDAALELTSAILRVFRDEGNRSDRQKGRLMWLIESYGKVETVEGAPHTYVTHTHTYTYIYTAVHVAD